MRFLIFISVFTISAILLEKIINKLLRVERKMISETSGRKADKWGRYIILVILLCTLPFFLVQDTNISSMKWYWILCYIVSLGFQSILEWKYLKQSKQYVTTLFFLILGVISLYNIENFLP